MSLKLSIIAAVGMCALPTAALADASATYEPRGVAASGKELPPYLQCVPYARQLTGVQIYGDAHTWWEQAAGRYERGNVPRVGAVMAFAPHRSMVLGHVAAVSRVIDSRTVLLDHANWSPIDGQRGQVERDVKAVDVSPNNDWSQVRVWYDPIGGLGTTEWPVHGFIYGKQTKLAQPRFAAAEPAARPVSRPAPAPASSAPSRSFLNAFADLERAPAATASRQPARQRAAPQPRRVASAPAPRPRDPIASALARYE